MRARRQPAEMHRAAVNPQVAFIFNEVRVCASLAEAQTLLD
jgi:hypothetical protein